MKYMLIIFLVLMITNVHANCEEGQIDINSASLSELDEIINIGLTRADLIIKARPFESV